MMLSVIYWREITWLWLVALPLLLWLFNRWRQQKKWQHIADAHLLPWVQMPATSSLSRLRQLSLFTGWLLLCIALAGPRTIKSIPPQYQGDPASIIFIIDLSASMNAQDVRPNRRDVVQKIIAQWLSRQSNALATGIVLFAGHAFELLPPTTDGNVLAHFIAGLNDIRLPTLGNNLPAAIQRAIAMLPDNQSPKRLLIFSDGDMEKPMQQKSSTLLQQTAQDAKLEISLIGIGHNKAVAVPDTRGELITEQARPVASRLQAGWMKQLAQQAHIHYLHASDASDKTLEAILQLPPATIDQQAQHHIRWQEWFSPLLILAVVFIALSLSAQQRVRVVASAILSSLLLSLFTSTPLLAAEPTLRQALQAVDNEDYETALKLFDGMDGYDAQFGKGRACYRLQDFKCARDAFSAAILQAKTAAQKAPAIFNLANSYFFLGDYDQAEVLYRDAQQHGIDEQRVKTNLAYALDLQSALRRHIRDIQETLRRAQWRAAASGDIRPEIEDLLANDRSVILPRNISDHPQAFYRAYQQVFKQQLNQLLGVEQKDGESSARNWVKVQQRPPQSTAALMNRLFEMEIGILAPQQQPRKINGQRQW